MVKGPKSFEDIRTVNGEICPTFTDACYGLGLLDDDKEYVEAIKEESHLGTAYYLRSIFSMMLISDSLSRPNFVWENTWEYLSDRILYNQGHGLKSPGTIPTLMLILTCTKNTKYLHINLKFYI